MKRSTVGAVLSQIALAGVFFGVFTPLGWCLRLLGRDALRLRRRPERDTYWIAKRP